MTWLRGTSWRKYPEVTTSLYLIRWLRAQPSGGMSWLSWRNFILQEVNKKIENLYSKFKLMLLKRDDASKAALTKTLEKWVQCTQCGCKNNHKHSNFASSSSKIPLYIQDWRVAGDQGDEVPDWRHHVLLRLRADAEAAAHQGGRWDPACSLQCCSAHSLPRARDHFKERQLPFVKFDTQTVFVRISQDQGESRWLWHLILAFFFMQYNFLGSYLFPFLLLAN